ncbi:MAG: hypothetical protein GQ570_04855 [Helicobacteraceae bacterium]|nr:hypothetical protein [Helicobacteraceae bacterium]
MNKKIILSALAALSISTAVHASTLTLYTDPTTGQVFTTPAEGRIEMGEFISAGSVKAMNKTQDEEIKTITKKSVPVLAKASKLKFSGVHYLGYNYTNNKSLAANADSNGNAAVPDNQTGKFEMRRNYVQVKAYLFDEPKSFLRVTMDATTQNAESMDAAAGSTFAHMDVYIKYAYLYLDKVLPYTGVEFGAVHRPWIDYEEHQAWFYRSISKVSVESKQAADLTNSADLGVNFKTKTPYFTSEIGLFNGEGYHSFDEANGVSNSLEWRATAAVLGNGNKKRKPKKDTYFDASFWGQANIHSAKNDKGVTDNATYKIYGLHTVYNQPSFLISAQYTKAENEIKDVTSKYNGEGYSVNGTYRFGTKKEWNLIARYDRWKSEKQNDASQTQETDNFIYGVSYQQNKNVRWILSGETYKALEHRKYDGKPIQDFDSVLLTSEVHW